MARTQEDVMQELKLEKIDAIRLDPTYLIMRHCMRVDEKASTDLTNISNFNTFSFALRAYQSNIFSKLDEDYKIYLGYLLERLKNSEDIQDKIDLQFVKYDFLNFVRDVRIADIFYATTESEIPGALSTFIANRLTKQKDSNFILGIFGPPRSGKSSAGGRIGLNTSVLSGMPLGIADVVYSHLDWLNVKEARRAAGTLKGSIQIIDEGGNVADAQRWWDSEVREIVEHLRTQGFDNTCTIIISPMYEDIANKARGLFHAVMYPWKEWGKRYLELTDTSSINSETNISTWKFDILNVDPMTGKTYLKKMQAAWGEIPKINVKLPPQEWIKPYLEKSEEYKLKLQSRQIAKAQEKQLLEEDLEKSDWNPEIRKTIIKRINKFESIRENRIIIAPSKIARFVKCDLKEGKRIAEELSHELGYPKKTNRKKYKRDVDGTPEPLADGFVFLNPGDVLGKKKPFVDSTVWDDLK